MGLGALLAALSAPLLAADIYEYRSPDGVPLFTDRAVMPSGYQLLSVRKGWTDRGAALPGAALRDAYDTHILQASLDHRVEAALIKAVIHAESAFDRHAVSRVGAQGLMQLMPETARYLKVSRPFDPAENIDGGARFLRYLMDRFDSLDHVLAAYNAGEGNVRRHGGIPPFAETRAYVRRIQELLPRYREQMRPREELLAVR